MDKEVRDQVGSRIDSPVEEVIPKKKENKADKNSGDKTKNACWPSFLVQIKSVVFLLPLMWRLKT